MEALQTTLAPLVTILLRDQEGHQGAWFCDLRGQVVGNHLGALAPAAEDYAVLRAAPVFDALWDSVVLGEARGEDEPGIDPGSLLGDLPPQSLASLVPAFMRGQGRARNWALSETLPPGLGYIVPTTRGLRACEPWMMTRALNYSIHRALERLVVTGRMSWPSPVDGSMVESDGFALLLDRSCFSYRFRHEAIGLVFHVVCSGGYFYNSALYFPTADLVVRLRPEKPFDHNALDHLREVMLIHLLKHHVELSAGARAAPDPDVHAVFGESAFHIGHYVWQDLAGITYLLRGI